MTMYLPKTFKVSEKIFSNSKSEKKSGYVLLERAVGKNEKLESFKLESLKLERAKRNWKELSKFGKLLLKLESFAEVGKFRRSWKVLAEVGKFE